MRNAFVAAAVGLASLLLWITLALADPVTGVATIGDDQASFSVTGADLSASTAWPTFASFITATLTQTIPTVPPNFGFGFSFATFGAIHANFLIGSLDFSGPAGSPLGVAQPVTVTGHLVGYSVASLADLVAGHFGDPVLILDLIGSGFGTPHGLGCPGCQVLSADYTYSGTMTALVPTPEPMSLLLLATGAGALVARPGWGWLRRRMG